MRFKVYPLRRDGRRLPWREVQNGPRYEGDLITFIATHGNEPFRVATLRPVGSPIAASPLPDLYEPVLLGFGPLAFRIRGFERVERPSGQRGVVQEWHCELP